MMESDGVLAVRVVIGLLFLLLCMSLFFSFFSTSTQDNNKPLEKNAEMVETKEKNRKIEFV